MNWLPEFIFFVKAWLKLVKISGGFAGGWDLIKMYSAGLAFAEKAFGLC